MKPDDALGVALDAIIPQSYINLAMYAERAVRDPRGLPINGLDQADRMAGVKLGTTIRGHAWPERWRRSARQLRAAMPIDARAHGVNDVLDAAKLFQGFIAGGSIRHLKHPVEQLQNAIRITRG